MPITPLQKSHVQRTFRQAAIQAELAADAVYKHLFELAPWCKMLFVCEMRQQGRRFIQMLAVAVRGLNNPDALAVELHELGQRHSSYGARRQDYQYVGEAVVLAMQDLLGEAFTPTVEDAWKAFTNYLIETTIAKLPDENAHRNKGER